MSKVIDDIFNLLKKIEQDMTLFMPDLTIEKEVIHFLKVDRRTFKKYLSEGTLVLGEHYINQKDKKVYIPEAIINFKKSGGRKSVTNAKAQEVLSSILK